MKYILLILILTTGCIVETYPVLKCRSGDYEGRARRAAIIAPSQPQPTLIIDRRYTEDDRVGIVMSQKDMDALECSIKYYRSMYGYTDYKKEKKECTN